MRKIYYLSTCDTCRRILKEWKPSDAIPLIDLKKNPLDEDELALLYSLAGSYESLFNKRARKLRENGLKSSELDESDFKRLLLEHYSFLKRPILLFDDQLFIGNSKKTVDAAKACMQAS